MPYADWLLKVTPPWLRARWAGGFLRNVGRILDEYRAEETAARLAVMPGATGRAATADSLAAIGLERQLDRGPAETSPAYGDRLQLAWDTWPRAGSHRALLEQLRIAGFDWMHLYIMQRSGRRTSLDLDGSLVVEQGHVWTFDGQPPEAYAQFGLIFTAPQPTLSWSGTSFSAAAEQLNRLAWVWRPAKAMFMGTRILGTGRIWGWPASVTWGTGDWGGSGGSFIPPR